MSDPREPEPPPTPAEPEPGPEAPPEHPHGLVEELKEELHEVVEHVPKPVRWTVSRIVGLVALILVGLVVVVVVSAGLYLARRTVWVAQEVALVLNQALATRSDVVLRLGDLRGNPLTGVRVLRPVVRFRDDDTPVLEASDIRLHYSAWGLLTGGKGPIEVEINDPVIQLPTRPDGSMRLPVWRSSGSGGGKGRALAIGVTIRRASVRLPVLKPGIEGLDLRARVRLGFGTLVDVDQMSWRSGPWGNALQNLRGQLDAGDSVRVRIDELRSSDLDMRARAAWKSGEAHRRVQLSVDRVRWAWLAKVFDNGVFDVPGQARIEASAEGDSRWRGRFRTSLDWNGLTADGRGGFSLAGRTIQVDSIEATSSGGKLAGRFEMVGKRWLVDARAEHSDPRTWKAFHLSGWPEGDLSGAFQIRENERHDLDLTARLGSSVLAGWHADSARVHYMGPQATTDSFTVAFFRRGGQANLWAGTRSWGWEGSWQAERFPLDEWPDGRASGLSGTLLAGRGGVVSRGSGLQVDGALEGESSVWLGARMARWRLGGVSGRLLPSPDLVAVARLEDFTFLGLHFDSSLVDFHLGDRQAALRKVSAFAGDTVLTLGGTTTWSAGGWDMSLDRAEAVSSQFHWTADPPLLLAGDPRGAEFERCLAHDRDARFEARGRWAAPGGEYGFDATVSRLDVGRIGLPTEWQLGGTADARLSVRGINGDPTWTFESLCRSPGQGGHRADSLALELAGQRHRLEVRRAVLFVDGGRLDASGRIEDTARPWPDTLTGPGVVRWLADAGRWSARARVVGLGLEDVDRLLRQPIGWSGRLNGELTLSGRPADPSFEARAEVRPFGWRDFSVDAASLQARFDARRLQVEELRLTRGQVSSRVSGGLPLRLALGEPPTLLEAPMDWTVDIPNGDLALLPVFVPQIGWGRGRFDLHAKLAGTPKSPQLAGTMAVRDGAIRLAGREEILDRLAADFHFDQSRITLDSLRAREGAQGTVRARGVVNLRGLALQGYRFDLGLRQFTATEEGLYAAEFDGDFVVTNGPKVSGSTLPQVTGKVDLHSAAVLFDFANQSETQQLAATTQPLFWTYRVQLEATRNLHWQPPDGDIEFSADLTLEQTPDSLQIYGDLTSLRGTYYFLSNRFDVARANLTFDNESGVNPQLDIEASAKVVPTQEPISTDLSESSSTSANRTHTVTARISGRAAEPVVEFSSDPADWDEPRILRELTVGRFFDARQGGVQLGDPLDNYLTRAINRTVSAEMSRAFRGYISEWELERERGGLLRGEGDLVLGVGSQITPNISLRYRQRVPGLTRPTTTLTGDIEDTFERDVEAEYRLNRFFYVTTELTQHRTVLGSITQPATDFNVNLKARWEY
jgi:hypothetical protein